MPPFVCVLVSVLVLFGDTYSQEIQLQRPVYSVAENISLDNLVLRVCVEGSNLADQTYNVQLHTEEADTNSALDGEDYVGINEALVLTGPGEDIRCTCVEVLEDELTETTERFRMRITGDTSLITRDTVDAFIEDNDVAEATTAPTTAESTTAEATTAEATTAESTTAEPTTAEPTTAEATTAEETTAEATTIATVAPSLIPLAFINDTPRVVGNEVTLELQFDPSLISLTCELIVSRRGSVQSVLSTDCSNGVAVFTLSDDLLVEYEPRITTVNAQGDVEIFEFPNRDFRSATGRCSVHLINEGISYDREAGSVTFQWMWTGPGAEGLTFCVVDSRPAERCMRDGMPYTVSGLEQGAHSMLIRVRRGGCSRGRANPRINFIV